MTTLPKFLFNVCTCRSEEKKEKKPQKLQTLDACGQQPKMAPFHIPPLLIAPP